MARKSQVQVENLLTMFWLLVTLKLPPEYLYLEPRMCAALNLGQMCSTLQ